jgi:hypothetical protein
MAHVEVDQEHYNIRLLESRLVEPKEAYRDVVESPGYTLEYVIVRSGD